MAQKRMFDRAIIDTDRFMDLPMSAKALYFLLGMEADDEGFVSYKKVIRIHGGNDDDIKVLAGKNFIIGFPSGVVVITDWNINNWLDRRRTRETEYQIEKKQLILTKTNKYQLNTGAKPMLSECLESIEESSIEEKSIEEYSIVKKPLSEPSSQPVNFQEEIKKMKAGNHHLNRIIATYWEYKTDEIIPPKTKEQFSAILKRELRLAKQLQPYDIEQVEDTMYDLNSSGLEWSLKAVINWIDKDREKIINLNK